MNRPYPRACPNCKTETVYPSLTTWTHKGKIHVIPCDKCAQCCDIFLTNTSDDEIEAINKGT